jgi:hypothetical protein
VRSAVAVRDAKGEKGRDHGRVGVIHTLRPSSCRDRRPLRLPRTYRPSGVRIPTQLSRTW